MISSGADVNRFLGALLRGELLLPAELRQMMTVRSTGEADSRAYGGATADGRQATVMVSLGPGSPDAQSDDIEAALHTALSKNGSAISGSSPW
ncbi:hypothetical protein [Streptomyces sp. NPDC127039]|uniref:hypothetical protein n=1 Tax=Streptomyces sp. NPDC127039 TaxID=3347115 RepID=UPI0036579283